MIEAMHLYCTYAHGICSDRKLVPPRRTDHPDKVFRSFPLCDLKGIALQV